MVAWVSQQLLLAAYVGYVPARVREDREEEVNDTIDTRTVLLQKPRQFLVLVFVKKNTTKTVTVFVTKTTTKSSDAQKTED